MQALDVYYDTARNRLDAQMQQIDGIDTKVATTFTVASVILAFFAGLLTLASLPISHGIRTADFILLGLSVGAYFFLAITLYRAYQVRDWSFRPNLEDLQTYCAEYTEDGMKEWVADACIASIQANTPRIFQKATRLKVALIALAGESALIALVGVVSLLGR